TFGMPASIAALRRRRTLLTKSKIWRKNMILLRPDCLVFKTPNGENIPCSVQEVSIELIGGAAVDCLDKEMIQNAATAVLHYFREELGRTSVTMGEFSEALEQALSSLGFKIKPAPPQSDRSRVAEADLLRLAFQSGKGCELFFFGCLREEVRRKLDLSPEVLCFRGLRVCVKQLTGAKRWNRRCQSLNDQIVDYLRTCLTSEKGGGSCALIVS